MKTRGSRKQFYDLERILKGVGNHRRIEIVFLLSKNAPLSTVDIVEQLDINYQTGAVHVQRLVRAGIVTAYRRDKEVLHELSPLGKDIIRLLINI